MTIRKISHADWLAEGERRFGKDPAKWAFKCPSCGHVTLYEEWIKAGAERRAAFSCIGRELQNPVTIFGKPGPCNYAGGGLFRLNPVHVVFPDNSTRETFEFADTPPSMTIPIAREPGEPPPQESADVEITR